MRRTKVMRAVFLVLLLTLCGRLYYIQHLCHDQLTAAAYRQQMIPVLQENGKGVIYDRNMIPLTGTDRAYYYLIHKDNLTTAAEQLLTQIDAEPAGQKDDDYLVYRTDHYVHIISGLLQKQHHAYGFSVDLRYGKEQAAASLLHDLDEMYAGLLQKEEPVFYFLGNAAGGLIHGTGVDDGSTTETVASAALLTTLDLELQRNMESILEETNMTGCAVISDTRTGQILAMASRTTDGTDVNLAVEKAYPLGKCSKIIQMSATAFDLKMEEAAGLLGLGTPVFDQYPGEDSGSAAEKNMSATAIRMNQLLTTLANHGQVVPLTFVMCYAKAESIPCMEIAGDAASKLNALQEELKKRPLTGDGWATGYEDAYALTVHLDSGNPKDTYQLLADCI